VVLGADFDIPIEHCGDGTIYASKNNEWLKLKWDGTPLQPDGRLVEGWCWSHFPMRLGDKIGLVAADGTSVTPFHFDAIARVGGRAWNVRLRGRWGRIATDGGRWLIEPKFDYLSTDEGLVVAAVDGKRGFLSLDGSWLIEPKFDAARLNKGIFDRRRDPDSAFVTISGATGLLRLKDQSWAIPPRPGVMCRLVSSTNAPENNAIISQVDSKLAVLSPSGESLFEIDADGIGQVRESGLVPFLKNGKWGLVDTAGQVMVEPQFDELDWGFERGIAWARLGESWCAIDRRGRTAPSIACTNAVPLGLGPGTPACKVEP
jgi:hypothetical protein